MCPGRWQASADADEPNQQCRHRDRVRRYASGTGSGHFILGEPLNPRNRGHRLRLRTVSELFSEVIQGDLDRDGLPSCRALEALERQEPFVNPTLANHALALLARMFRYGTIFYHEGSVGLSSLAGLQVLRIGPPVLARRSQEGPRRESPTPMVIAGGEPPLTVATDWLLRGTKYPVMLPDILIMLRTN
jgi:hypothetical protein